MGKIQRKKDPAKKKKKKPAGDAEASAPAAGGGISLLRGPAKEKKPSSPQARTATAPKGPAKDNFVGKSVQFLREVKVELKKVTWPSRKQTIGSTVVVIVLVLIISVFLGAVDMGLSSIVRVVLQ